MQKVAQELTEAEKQHDIKLSAYGWAMFVFELYGVKSLYTNMGNSSVAIQKYVDEAVKIRDEMPTMLYNASQYVSKLLETIPDLDTCFKQLEGMSFPYILYVLFAGGGKKDKVECYREDFLEQLLRYPSMLDKLPDTFKQITNEAVDGNTET